jgi:uncharacterized membrane protein YbhN (UPF0104 family)
MAWLSRVLTSRILRWGFVALTVAIGCYYVAEKWGDIHHALDRIGLLTSFLSLVCVLAALFCSMLVWRVLLAGLGSPLPVRVASRVLFVGQLGKYLPGSVWPVLAQMELATEHNVPRLRTGAASIINMGLSLLCALLAAFVTLPFTGGFTKYWWAFFMALPLLACLYPPVLNTLLRFGFKLLRRPALEQALTGNVIAVAMGWSLLSWVCYGAQIWVLMLKLGVHAGSSLPLSVGAFAFAWAVGFVVILAPAGAGFRDALLAAFLAPSIGIGPATAISLVSRIATALADMITASVAVISYRRSKSRQAAQAPGNSLGPREEQTAEEQTAEEETAVAESPRPDRA